MAADGTGTGWDTTAPANSDLVKDGAKEIRDLRLTLGIRMNKEHVTLGSSSAGGAHLAGSAVGFYQSSAPTSRLEGTSLAAADNGRLWIDSDDEVLYHWVNGTGFVSTKVGAISSTLTSTLKASIGSPIGTVVSYIGTSAPTDWLILNGDTFGSASSGATKASADYETLWKLFWDSMADAQAPVTTGRGASAAADWAANKIMTMPDARGRGIIGTGAGAIPSVLTARTHGAKSGAETHQLVEAELPAHNHDLKIPDTSYSINQASVVARATGTTVDTNVTDVSGCVKNAGSDTAHENMPPWIALNHIVKY